MRGSATQSLRGPGHALGQLKIQIPPTSPTAAGTSDQGKGSSASPTAVLAANATRAARLPVRLIAPLPRQAAI